MSNTLGNILIWALYLGGVRIVAPECIPFILYAVGACVFLGLIAIWATKKPPFRGGF